MPAELYYDEDEDRIRHMKCERCGTVKDCESVPLMGYSEWWCERCYQWAVASGEIKG